MSAPKRIVRLQAMREGGAIALAFETEDGETIRLAASDDQVDWLIDELEDVLNSPADEE